MNQSRARCLIIVLGLGLAACGGSSGPSSTSGDGPKTITFTGATRTATNGACSSLTPDNAFSASPGTITVTLVQAGTPRLQLQVCATTETNHTNCTVPPFAPLSVGQSLTATLKGSRTQSVVLYPEGCGASNAPSTDPIPYTVSVTYPG